MMETQTAVRLLHNYRMASIALHEWRYLEGRARDAEFNGEPLPAYQAATADAYAQAITNEAEQRIHLIALLEKTDA